MLTFKVSRGRAECFPDTKSHDHTLLELKVPFPLNVTSDHRKLQNSSMQKIFSKHKRKQPQDGHSDEREPKHTKHEVSPLQSPPLEQAQCLTRLSRTGIRKSNLYIVTLCSATVAHSNLEIKKRGSVNCARGCGDIGNDIMSPVYWDNPCR